MTEPLSPLDRILVVGANHRSSSLAMRDRLFVEEHDLPAFLERLRSAGIDQAIVLSTCDRVEIQSYAGNGPEAGKAIEQVMSAHAELNVSELDGQLYHLKDDAAVRHVFNVASSLDSLVIGEPQVLGQVKDAHRLAQETDMTGPEMEAVLQAAYSAAKRVRSETSIALGPVSISSVAVRLARDLHGDLDRCTALMVGVGDMGEMVATDLLKGGLGNLTITHPTQVRAEAMARALDCHVAPFDGLDGILSDADIVLTSLGSRRHAIRSDMMMAAIGKRRHKPVFMIDTGIPGDIDPAIDKIEDAFRYTLDDLETLAMKGLASRSSQSKAAFAIIDAEVSQFIRGTAERDAVSSLTRLREHFEGMRESVLADAGDDAEKATRLLVNRLLHDPSLALKEIAADSQLNSDPKARQAVEEVLREVFRLGDDEDEKDS